MRKRKETSRKPALETQYEQLFGWPGTILPPDTPETYQQPTPLKIVRSVTTYSAYEDPITDE
jgi:hypothetical protein